MTMIRKRIAFTILLISAGLAFAEDSNSIMQERLGKIPEGFTRFEFKNCQREADVFSNYLWYFFDGRAGYFKAPFYQEYMLTSDMWLGGAFAKSEGGKSVQQVRREHLLSLEADQEGCIKTYQHFSHSHDDGWPFPLWTQYDVPEKVSGQAVGWHFQDYNDVPGWVGDLYLKNWKIDKYYGETAVATFTLNNVESQGIKDKKWHLKATGVSPVILSPDGEGIDPEGVSFIQIRWKRTGEPAGHAMPYVEWKRDQDDQFSSDRRMYYYPDKTSLSPADMYHSMIPLHLHPQWNGHIKQLRFSLAPGESEVEFDIDSIFCHFDTRHAINNPIFIMASARYFNWSGDLDFLRQIVNRLRSALRYQQTVMGGLKYNYIRNPWPGHEGTPGWHKDAQGNITVHGGKGIGTNYWDIMPFSGSDMYSTSQYYASLLAMAEIEQAIVDNPSWAMPKGVFAFEPDELLKHAAEVKKTANKKFWNPKTGRFYATIDEEGNKWEYGFTFLNLDAIWYGIASDEHAKAIMDWITGERIVEGDTSTGEDIYHWRFGPRATTRRNLEWYTFPWTGPEVIAWGGQVQDGGAVLGFSFYDLWARLKVLGADNAWQRFTEIADWEEEVWAEGGYRKYYEGGKRGTTLQGGGTAGGLGVDAEFLESSLLTCIIPYGFVGLEADPDKLVIKPNLPSACPEMTVKNLWYRNVQMDVTVTNSTIELNVKQDPVNTIQLRLDGKWQDENTKTAGSDFVIDKAGTYKFSKQ